MARVNYKGVETKIGVLNSYFCVSYQKFTTALNEGHLQDIGKSYPISDFTKMERDFYFRFPFPDEDHRKFGDVDDYHRSIPILIRDPSILNDYYDKSRPYEKVIKLESQLGILRESDNRKCLAAFFSYGNKGQTLRVEEDSKILKIVKQFMKNNVEPELDPEKKNLYKEIANRILDGYQLEMPKLKIHQSSRLSSKAENVASRLLKRKKGKGL
ncbi:hypothetical protein [Pedobacter sp. HMWF019]|uniref:hypothetical protein n=1 Tax=Pedobacter sp. HMWF019 TaxID=2056856 RepID=UPI001304F911|nr:hypothetical protein [Pedobacter sp. HMWF019]